MAEIVLTKVKKYNKKLYDEALKEPRAFVSGMDVEEEKEYI